MSTAHGRNRDNGPLGKKLKNLYDLIEGIEIAKDRTRDGVSVSGTATISQNRLAIRELYQRDWKAWSGDQGGERGPGAEIPRILGSAWSWWTSNQWCTSRSPSLLRSCSLRWPRGC
jgi:hypothetical protein